jgi:peptidoglycan hydrolase CwlO-like protein
MMSKEYFYSRNICCSEVTEHPDHYLAKFVICDFSVNGNQVALNRETIESWMSTLVGNPLVGKLVVAPRGELDFSGHNMKVVTRKDDDGNEYKTAEFDTDAFGSFQSVGIEKIDDTDFIVASCKIWKRYPKACATILRRIESGTLNTSWEIDVLKAHKGIVGGRMAKIIDDGVFTAHCLLGANVEPAYKCSKLLEVAETDFGLELANAYIEDTKEISNIESNEKEAKNLELNKDKETQTAQVENPTETEQAEQTATESTTKPTTPAEPDVQTSEEGSETPPPTEPETSTEPAGEPEPESTTETSSLTGRDLYMKLEDAVSKISSDYYMTDMFPEDHTIWCKKWGYMNELDYIMFPYTVEGDEVSLGEPQNITLTVSVSQVNTKIDELNKTVASLNTELQSAKDEIAELTPYKEQAEKAAAEKAEAELAQRKENLRQYAISSKMITEAELTGEGEFASMIENLDEAGINGVIASRCVEAAKNAKPAEKKIETSEVHKPESIKLNLNETKYNTTNANKRDAWREYLGK